MTQPSVQSGTVHGRTRWSLAFLSGSLVTLVTVSTGLLSVDGVKDEACRWRADQLWKKETTGPEPYREAFLGCGDSYSAISIAGAEDFIRNYMGKRSGADPGSAWALRTGEAREVTTRDEFIAAWENSLWAELVSSPDGSREAVSQSDGFNHFIVFSREYAVDGRVTSRRTNVTLTVDRGELRLYSEDEGRRLAAPVITYPRATVLTDVNTYQLPRSDSDPAVFSHEMNTDGTGWLEVLCQLNTPDGAWLRTPQGWIRRDATEVDRDPTFDCNPEYQVL